MKQLPIVVSHYTISTPYEDEVKNLRRSLDTLELEYWITGITTLGNWRANSNWCAEQVWQALIRYPDRDILRVDADATFHRKPDIFLREDFQADIAAHVHDFRWRKQELMGGTLYFQNNEKVRALVDKWSYLCCRAKRKDRNGDLLKELIINTPEIQFEELPDTYCKIFDLMKDVEEPVIQHWQASRRHKGKVNQMGLQRTENGQPGNNGADKTQKV